MAARDPFVSLVVTPARSKPPGPTFVATSDHLPRGEHGGPVSLNEERLTSSEVSLFRCPALSLSGFRWPTVSRESTHVLVWRKYFSGTGLLTCEQNVRNPG